MNVFFASIRRKIMQLPTWCKDGLWRWLFVLCRDLQRRW